MPRTYLYAFLLCISVLCVTAHLATAQDCTHYASRTGGGDGLSQGSPYQIRDFLENGSHAIPGSVLCLLSSSLPYTGFRSMLTIPPGLSGNSSAPITVRALEDGGVYLNGEYTWFPLYMEQGSSYWVIEGIDFGQAVNSVLYFDDLSPPDTHHITVKRSCFFNANLPPRPGATAVNQHTILLGGNDHLLEDVCAFGYGRNNFVDGNNQRNVIRRLWTKWQAGNDVGEAGGPNFQLDYSVGQTTGHDTIYENLIAVYSSDLTPPDTETTPYLGWVTRTGLANGEVTAGNGNLFAGFIVYAYDNPNQPAWNEGYYAFNRWAPNRIRDQFIDARAQPQTHPVSFSCELADSTGDHPAGPSDCSRVIVDRITVWQHPSQLSSVLPGNQTNFRTCTDLSNCPNIFTGDGGSGPGARLCNRYVNGVYTNTPLWPWPMDSRIKQALQRGGSAPLSGSARAGWYDSGTVSSEIAFRYGAIPDTCLTGGTPPPAGVTKTFWKMEEGAGASLIDASTSGNTATLTGSPIWGAGKVGSKSLILDGSTQYADATFLSMASNAYTWMLWVKGSAPPETASVERVIVNGTTTDSFGFNWSHVAASFRQAAQHISTAGTEYSAQIVSTLLPDVWYHIAGTYNGNVLRVYLNGIEQNAVTGVAAPRTPVGTLRLGAKGDGTQLFCGNMDNAYFENRALSAAEILFAYRSTAGTPRARAVSSR